MESWVYLLEHMDDIRSCKSLRLHALLTMVLLVSVMLSTRKVPSESDSCKIRDPMQSLVELMLHRSLEESKVSSP